MRACVHSRGALEPLLRAAGFDRILVEGHLFATAELTPQPYASAILPLIERFVGGREEIGELEARAWAAEQQPFSPEALVWTVRVRPAPTSSTADG